MLPKIKIKKKIRKIKINNKYVNPKIKEIKHFQDK